MSTTYLTNQIISHKTFMRIANTPTDKLTPVNIEPKSRIAKSFHYAEDSTFVFVRQKIPHQRFQKGVEKVTVESASGEITLTVGSVFDWLNISFEAHRLLGTEKVQFEMPIGCSNEGLGIYYSLGYAGIPLSSHDAKTKLKADDALLLIEAVATMHSNGIYHGHLTSDNILIMPDQSTFVIVDPKLLHKESSINQNEKLSHIRVDLSFLHSFTKIAHMPSLNELEQKYQSKNRVGGEVIIRKFFDFPVDDDLFLLS